LCPNVPPDSGLLSRTIKEIEDFDALNWIHRSLSSMVSKLGIGYLSKSSIPSSQDSRYTRNHG
jgi:hypothetical protein